MVLPQGMGTLHLEYAGRVALRGGTFLFILVSGLVFQLFSLCVPCYPGSIAHQVEGRSWVLCTPLPVCTLTSCQNREIEESYISIYDQNGPCYE